MTATLVDPRTAPAGPDDHELLLDRSMPVSDLVITEHLVVPAGVAATYDAAADLDFMTVRTPLLAASMLVRGLPARLRGRAEAPPPELRLVGASGPGLPGWLLLGLEEDHEIAFGAVGRFWEPDIEWRDVSLEDFPDFAEPGWGKIGCHLLVRPDGPGRSILTYEVRVATTDEEAGRKMARYWVLIRPFVGHIMRATLRTIARDAVALRR